MVLLPLKRMPGPKGLPIIGSMLDYSRFGKYVIDGSHVTARELFKKYGRIYKEQLGNVTMVHIFHPEDAATVFRNCGPCPRRPVLPVVAAARKREKIPLGLSDINGKEWFHLRKTVQKLVMLPKTTQFNWNAQNDVGEDFIQMLRESSDGRDVIEGLYQQLVKYVMETIGVFLFNMRLGCLQVSTTEDSIAHSMTKSYSDLYEAIHHSSFASPWYLVHYTPIYNQYLKAKLDCDRLSNHCFQTAMSNHEHDKETSQGDSFPQFLPSLVATGADDNTISGIVTDLFTSGIESTCSTLSFALYSLAHHPSKQDKLFEEIQRTLSGNDPITHTMIERMPYIRGCYRESLRLHGNRETTSFRVLESDLPLGGFLVPKGITVSINHQTMCLQERYFEHPERFLPERWLKHGSADTFPPPPFAMLPFGYGIRMCVGRRIAEQAIFVSLIKILQAFRLEYHPKHVKGKDQKKLNWFDRPLSIDYVPRLSR